MFKNLWAIRSSWGGYFAVILVLHAVGIVGLVSAARTDPAFWSLGLLAYTFGLRHAFDVDHIAAIDNTVRKLIQQKRNPLGVGFYFSLGHSSVVFLMVLAIALSIKWLQDRMPVMQEVGGIIGTTVSGAFLVIIGLINLVILLNLYQVFRKLRSTGIHNEQLEDMLDSRGLFSRLLKPMFRLINRSWHVYPLGFLFGLGFDTATEIGLLAISASAAKTSIPVFGIIALPLLFAAGMSLMDTADGMFMTKAYRWAFTSPIKKLYYNVTVTTVSVIAALIIGMVELIQVLSDKLQLEGSFFLWINELDFGDFGYLLVALFLLAWIVSVTVWKVMKVEQRYTRSDQATP
ncbi:HoxN/HupN/NixA family nickel/cobalt transporter [Paenibacillus doosanensis]|uniref:Nickel/cobalt efflux system n=1 Tax=Paenibacillus konkukensis TaxID=2020716 RepID=A0ABY4RF57_9BACL|nr:MULTISPECIES: HoxN/HupN/NixA family nickel/cobalt transporter [Paenibacillus]MCS7462294.1 HoxN/HupN/NixA family nickel/cobalt transporter [Paenibacillus doosanensis]UQZ80895.1 High-affinity nickel-transport protein NixA [Paenibacillus konkukensis]